MIQNGMSRRKFLSLSAMTAAAMTIDMKTVSAFSKTMGDKHNYSTIIIGAGLGGLCCGAYLARQGIPVTVIEQHDRPGGYATAFNRAKGKFTFDVSLHATAAKNNALANTLNNLGIHDRIEIVEPVHEYCIQSSDFECCVPQRNPEAYIKTLSDHFPDEAEGIRQFVNEMIAIADEAYQLSIQGMPFKLFFPFKYPKMWGVRNKTLDDMLNEYVRDQRLKRVLSVLWPYYGLPPKKLSGFYYSVATGDFLKNGAHYIKERSQTLSDAMADVIREAGGKVMLETRVDKIVVTNNVATGVQLASGDYLPAKAVVSNASALATFNTMVSPDAIPGDYRKTINSYRPSLSSFIVWLGLNKDVTKTIKKSHIYTSPNHSPEKDYESGLKGDIQTQSYGLVIYDNIFDGYSPKGSTVVSIVTLCGFEPWRQFQSDYFKGDKTAYYKQKEMWTNTLIKRVEADIIPGLTSMIEVKESASPLTNWSYTGNTDGAIYGFEQSMDNAFINRIQNRTPIEGLYLAGAWGNPGGGYAGVIRSGENTFQQMMEDWGA